MRKGWRSSKYEYLVDLYEIGEYTVGQLSSHYDVSHQAVTEALVTRGAKLRDKSGPKGTNNILWRGNRKNNRVIHSVVGVAKRSGHLEVVPCESCGKLKKRKDGHWDIGFHHDDYNFPLRVRPLCGKCHKEWHKHNKPIYRIKEPSVPGSEQQVGL